jgi:hypothetical protein
MKISQAEEERLQEYIDGTLSAVEKDQVEQLIKKSPALQSRLSELNMLDTTLRSTRMEHPSDRFTHSIMGKLQAASLGNTSLSLRNSVFLLAGVLLVVGIGSVLVGSGVFDGTSSIDLNDTLKNKYIPESFPTITLSGKLIMNIIIIINLAIAFIILDRAVLKPWFARRTRMHA